MKQGKTLDELAKEIMRIKTNSIDYVASTALLEMKDGMLGTKDGSHAHMQLNDYSHGQVAQRVGIPKKYYDTMRCRTKKGDQLISHVGLLDTNVNYWFRENKEDRMLRTVDNKVRAFLSDKYRRLDNDEFADTVFPIIANEKMKVESSEITEQRLYIKALSPRFMGEVKKDDIVQFGIVLSNSEVGAGSLKIEPLLYRLVCKNGLISNTALRKYHVGKSGSESGLDRYMHILSEDTRRMDNKVFWRKVGEIVNYSLREDVFNKLMDAARNSTERIMTAEPTDVIKKLSKIHSLNEGEGESILNHLARGGDLTQWGLTNAITRYSQDVDDYDKATEFERLGGTIVSLDERQWKHLN